MPSENHILLFTLHGCPSCTVLCVVFWGFFLLSETVELSFKRICSICAEREGGGGGEREREIERGADRVVRDERER